MKIFVVIVNYNGKQWNKVCLEALLTDCCADFAVIFVDNASTDDSLLDVQNYFFHLNKIQYIPLKQNYLFAYGANCGIRSALEQGADYIFLLNNDTIIEPNCLSQLYDFLQENPAAAGVQPVLVRMNDIERVASAGCCISRMGGAWDYANGQLATTLPEDHFEVSGITGGASLWRASALRKIGLFDENFGMYFEDVDLSLRARKQGYKLYTLPKARVQHMVSATTNTAPSGFCVRYCQTNALRLLLKHWPKKWIWQDVALWFCMSCISLFANALMRQWGTVRAIARGIYHGLVFLPSGIWKRIHSDTQQNDALISWIDRKCLYPPKPDA